MAMKSFLRTVLFNSFSLFVLSQVIPGFKVSGGLVTFLFGGLALSILFIVIKPILNLLTLPLNLVTLGMFSFLSNVIIFYLLTVFVPQIGITAFTFEGINYAGFVIPKMAVNVIISFIVVAVGQSLVVTFLSWLTKK